MGRNITSRQAKRWDPSELKLIPVDAFLRKNDRLAEESIVSLDFDAFHCEIAEVFDGCQIPPWTSTHTGCAQNLEASPFLPTGTGGHPTAKPTSAPGRGPR